MLGLLGAALAQAPPPVVGGSETSDWSGVGALVGVTASGDEGITFCTGTLIAADRVLTAAHCVDYAAELAELDLEFWFFMGRDVFAADGVDDYAPIERLQKHPDYSEQALLHDVAVLDLAYEVQGEVYTLTESTLGSSWVGRDLWHVGFGITNWDQDDAGIKREVMLEVTAVEDAQVIHEGTSGENLCFGDSGGPVFDPDDNSVVGIASIVWVYSETEDFCEDGGAGSARVDIDLQWIEETADLDSSEGGGGGDTSGDDESPTAEPTTGSAGQLPDDEAGLGCSVGSARPASSPMWWLGLAGLVWRRRYSVERTSSTRPRGL